MAAEGKKMEGLPSESTKFDAAIPLPSPPWPPLMDWLINHAGRVKHCNNDNDAWDRFYPEMKGVAEIIRRMRERRGSPLKSRPLPPMLAQVREAARVMIQNLPALIAAAESELSRKLIDPKMLDTMPELFVGRNDVGNELALEIQLLALARAVREGKGFYGPTPAKRQQEPWASDADIIFSLFQYLYAHIRAPFPSAKSVSERTPIIGGVREALAWIGHGDLAPERIAQSLKRSQQRRHRRGDSSVMSAYETGRLGTTLSALAGQCNQEMCPDDKV